MTGAKAVNLSLPFRAYDGFPTTQADRIEWAIETAVGLFCEYEDSYLIGQIRVHRPDLSLDELIRKLEELCYLSEQVRVWGDCADHRAAEAAKDDYRGFLYLLALSPSTYDADVDQALAIVSEVPTPAPADELATRRKARA